LLSILFPGSGSSELAYPAEGIHCSTTTTYH
jgi:hypothetical protein